MTIRCKDGDLAMVIYDEESCVGNIGKLVKVAGPLAFNSDIQKQCWLIEPINPEPWYCTNFKGEPFQKVVTFASMIEHPDDWLTPLRPSTDDESEQQSIGKRINMTTPIALEEESLA